MPLNPISNIDLDLILTQTAEQWEEVRGQHLFITGGTGFFGCWLLASFCHINRALNLNATATVLTRDPVAFRAKCPHLASDSAIALLGGDIRNFHFPDGEFRYVVHAASEAYTNQNATTLLNQLTSIIDGTQHTLHFAATHGTQKYLFTSSGAVYGRQPSEITHLPETYPGGPDTLEIPSAYGEAKRTAEVLCAIYGQKNKMECKIARCWAFSGPMLPLDQHFAIGNFVGDVLGERAICIHGDGTPRRSYLYAADLTIWLWTILFKAPSLVAFNVGSAHDVSIAELARIVADTLSPDTKIKIAREPIPGTPVSRYVPCVNRASEVLNLRETVGLKESIRRMAAWYKG